MSFPMATSRLTRRRIGLHHFSTLQFQIRRLKEYLPFQSGRVLPKASARDHKRRDRPANRRARFPDYTDQFANRGCASTLTRCSLRAKAGALWPDHWSAPKVAAWSGIIARPTELISSRAKV